MISGGVWKYVAVLYAPMNVTVYKYNNPEIRIAGTIHDIRTGGAVPPDFVVVFQNGRTKEWRTSINGIGIICAKYNTI
jgi:hypothetical protein